MEMNLKKLVIRNLDLKNCKLIFYERIYKTSETSDPSIPNHGT